MNVEEGVLIPPKASHTDSVDVSVQDSTTSNELLGSDNDNTDSKQLFHDRSHKDHHADLEEQLPVRNQPSNDDQHPSEEQHSISEQHLAKDQVVEVTHDSSSSNVHREVQHASNPEGTTQSSHVDAHQSLREVSNRSGSPRVTKNRRQPTQPGPITRNVRADPNPNPSPYTAAQLYQLADYLKEQERQQEKQDWVKDLAAKQAELEKSNRHRANLQAECAQLKARLRKYSKISEHLVTMVKAYNGIGHDIKGLQTSRAEYDRDIRELRSQIDTNLNAAANAQQHIAKLERWKVSSLSLIREFKSTTAALTKEKSDLERCLRETSLSLIQEKKRCDTFDKHLQTYRTERNSTEKMLNGCLGKIGDHLGEFKTFIEQSTSSNGTSHKLLELLKKEDVSISEQIRSSGKNMDALKTSVEQLTSG